MAGIYIHIPFCKKACHYCNFHFSTSLALRDQLVTAICKEIEKRKDYLSTNQLKSIYFGGGTPSLLSENNLNEIFDELAKWFHWSDKTEITLEANPDDIDEQSVNLWNKKGINRLSIGIQSFFDEDLQWMNRAHNSQQALDCILLARACGINQISADLIYGLPCSTMDRWQQNVEQMILQSPDHISSYCLTVEASTALAHFVNSGKVKTVPDEVSAQQFLWGSTKMESAGYNHYEISNFAKNTKFAVHNSAYWNNKEYLGIGPSAHSFNGKSRQWNVANNPKYIKSVEKNKNYYTIEYLTEADHYNECVMTGFRTKWGVDSKKISEMGAPYLVHFLKEIQQNVWSERIIRNGNNYSLPKEAWLYADRIASDFFILNESF